MFEPSGKTYEKGRWSGVWACASMRTDMQGSCRPQCGHRNQFVVCSCLEQQSRPCVHGEADRGECDNVHVHAGLWWTTVRLSRSIPGAQLPSTIEGLPEESSHSTRWLLLTTPGAWNFCQTMCVALPSFYEKRGSPLSVRRQRRTAQWCLALADLTRSFEFCLELSAPPCLAWCSASIRAFFDVPKFCEAGVCIRPCAMMILLQQRRMQTFSYVPASR